MIKFYNLQVCKKRKHFKERVSKLVTSLVFFSFQISNTTQTSVSHLLKNIFNCDFYGAGANNGVNIMVDYRVLYIVLISFVFNLFHISRNSSHMNAVCLSKCFVLQKSLMNIEWIVSAVPVYFGNHV